jgi:hypothetical protein
MRPRIILFPVFLAVFSACDKPYFQNNLVFEKNGNRYEFTVTVTSETLYIAGWYNGIPCPGGDSGYRMAGKDIYQAAVADLDSDGDPEVYVFFRPPDLGPGIKAITCDGKTCSGVRGQYI